VTQLSFFYAFNFGDFGIAAAMSVLSLILPFLFAFTLIFATKFYKID
jgi:ABC-type sugar transport system permease subunit